MQMPSSIGNLLSHFLLSQQIASYWQLPVRGTHSLFLVSTGTGGSRSSNSSSSF